MLSSGNNDKKRPNCHSCINFSVTWQTDYPYACKAFSMKCRFLPSVEVKKRSGYDCLYFTKKSQIPQKDALINPPNLEKPFPEQEQKKKLKDTDIDFFV